MERPIPFKAPMVRALLAGAKTQTRRVVKPQPQNDPAKHHPIKPYDNGRGGWNWVLSATGHGTRDPFPCPYGVPGDRLWVRESFWGCDMPGYGDTPCVVYDDEWVGREYKPAAVRPWGRKFGRIPSIHMPRDASRITLEVTGVRVERLQAISEADAKAEGSPLTSGSYSHRGWYRELWGEINGPGSWDANPWVWCVDFVRAKGE